MTYSELKTLVADYLHRTDLTAKIPGFVALAEAFLFRELSVKTMEIAVSGVAVGGFITLPADCEDVGRVVSTSSGAVNALDYASNPRIDSHGVLPLSYTLQAGGLQLDLSVAGQAYTLYYTPILAALSDINPSNWLLANAPDLYLAAAQREAAIYTQDPAKLASMSEIIPGLLDSVQRRIKRTGQPARGGMQIKPRGTR